MTDATRRPGDVPPAEGHRTTSGLRSDTTDPDTRVSGTREEAGRNASAPDGDSPLVAARPQRGDTAPVGAGAHHDGDRTPVGAGARHDGDRTPAARLLRLDDTDKLTARLQHAVAGFVDAPRDAVQEADRALQELTERFTEAVTERRRTLRRSWQDDGVGEDKAEAATDTEQLRLALRDYRELAERLLHA
jgi:hypothetical protein